MEMHLPNKFLLGYQNSHVICAMEQHNQPTRDLIAQHLKCCYGHSEMPEQSLSSKYFSIIAPRTF